MDTNGCWNTRDWHNSKPSNFSLLASCCCSRQAQPPTGSSWHLPAEGGCLTHPWVCKMSPDACIYTHPTCCPEIFNEQLVQKVQDDVQMIDSLILLFHKVLIPSHKPHTHTHTQKGLIFTAQHRLQLCSHILHNCIWHSQEGHHLSIVLQHQKIKLHARNKL